jgi:outer membrane protein OmpA-like peptidoglycan-associated protein
LFGQSDILWGKRPSFSLTETHDWLPISYIYGPPDAYPDFLGKSTFWMPYNFDNRQTVHVDFNNALEPKKLLVVGKLIPGAQLTHITLTGNSGAEYYIDHPSYEVINGSLYYYDLSSLQLSGEFVSSANLEFSGLKKGSVQVDAIGLVLENRPLLPVMYVDTVVYERMGTQLIHPVQGNLDSNDAFIVHNLGSSRCSVKASLVGENVGEFDFSGCSKGNMSLLTVDGIATDRGGSGVWVEEIQTLFFSLFNIKTESFDIFPFSYVNESWLFNSKVFTRVNSMGDEVSPFFDQTSNSLYFSSSGHNGLGKRDIFRYSLDTTYEPLNLGYPINTPASEESVHTVSGRFIIIARGDSLIRFDRANIETPEYYKFTLDYSELGLDSLIYPNLNFYAGSDMVFPLWLAAEKYSQSFYLPSDTDSFSISLPGLETNGKSINVEGLRPADLYKEVVFNDWSSNYPNQFRLIPLCNICSTKNGLVGDPKASVVSVNLRDFLHNTVAPNKSIEKNSRSKEALQKKKYLILFEKDSDFLKAESLQRILAFKSFLEGLSDYRIYVRVSIGEDERQKEKLASSRLEVVRDFLLSNGVSDGALIIEPDYFQNLHSPDKSGITRHLNYSCEVVIRYNR